MPRRLLREPHLLAHELRTPLTLLAGWYSLMSSGEIDPSRTPKEWKQAMEACQRSVARLNLIIREACDEAETQANDAAYQRYLDLAEATRRAITHSQEILATVRRQRRGEPRPDHDPLVGEATATARQRSRWPYSRCRN